MKPRDLYFASYHQAAHVVAAITLGCRIEHVDIGSDEDQVGWVLANATVSDIETISAAGFEMEVILGRLRDQAWSRSEVDRTLMGELYSERTGLTMDKQTLEQHFNQGAVSAHDILSHQTSRKAVDVLADALNDLYNTGERQMSGETIYKITGEVTGFAAAAS